MANKKTAVEQYEILQRTFGAILDRATNSYFLDLLNNFTPFINLRTVGGKPIDMHLYKILVLLMEADKKEKNGNSPAYQLIIELRNKFFDQKNSGALTEEFCQRRIHNFLTVLNVSLINILVKQMEENRKKGSDKKPLIIKPLNNLARTHDYSYRITREKISNRPDSVYNLVWLEKEKKKTYLEKTVADSSFHLGANLLICGELPQDAQLKTYKNTYFFLRGKDSGDFHGYHYIGLDGVLKKVDLNNANSVLEKGLKQIIPRFNEDENDNNDYDTNSCAVRLSKKNVDLLITSNLITENDEHVVPILTPKEFEAYEATRKKWLKRVAIFFVAAIAIGSGALTAVATLSLLGSMALPAMAVMAIVVLIGVCGTYVNYKLFQHFFEEFSVRLGTKGIFDTLFGEKAPLNLLKRLWEEKSGRSKTFTYIKRAGLVFGGLLITGLVLGLSLIVATATAGSIMSLFTVTSPGLFVLGIAAAAVVSFASFVVYIPTTLNVLTKAVPTFLGVWRAMWDLIGINNLENNVQIASDGKVSSYKIGALIGKVAKGVIVAFFAPFLIVPVSLLVLANVLTIKNFHNSTQSLFGFCSWVCVSVAAVPGQILMAINGLFSTVIAGIEAITPEPAILQDRTNEKISDRDTSASRHNPWTSLYHRVFGWCGYGGVGGSIIINGLGNGFLAAEGARNWLVRVVVIVAASLGSMFSCLLGFLGNKSASAGAPGAAAEVKDTFNTFKMSTFQAEQTQPNSASSGDAIAQVEQSNSPSSPSSSFSNDNHQVVPASGADAVVQVEGNNSPGSSFSNDNHQVVPASSADAVVQVEGNNSPSSSSSNRSNIKLADFNVEELAKKGMTFFNTRSRAQRGFDPQNRPVRTM